MFHNNFPGFSGLVFCKKLARTKTQQSIDKASKRNSCTVLFGLWYFSSINRSGIKLFYHSYSPSFTYSLFAPTPLFVSASAIECFRYSLSRVSSDGCCIPVPPYIVRCHCTIMTDPYRYLLPLLCQSKYSETKEAPLLLAGVPSPCSPPPITTPPLSIPPMPTPLSFLPQENFHPLPHRFRRSPIFPPQNHYRS